MPAPFFVDPVAVTLPRRTIALAAAALGLLLVHMMLLAGAPPVARFATVALPYWPAGATPVRIALLSDLHTAWPGDTPARLRATVARVAALRPDIVIVAGDALSNHTAAYGYAPDRAIAAIGRLHPPLGAFAVLGNHDYDQEAAVRRALARAGFRLLDNEAARAGPLAIVGIADPVTGHADAHKAVAAGRALGGAMVAAMHGPTPMFTLAPDVHLGLAGHTHCGQISLPLFGSVAPEMRRMRYNCGLLDWHGRTSIVTAGLGTSKVPFRLGVPPDFWIVTVGPKAP